MNNLIQYKLETSKESENSHIRGEITLKKIWRLAREFFRAEIQSLVGFTSDKRYRHEQPNFLEICDQYVTQNFDSEIFQNLGQNFMETVAEAIAALVDIAGFQNYVCSTLEDLPVKKI